MYCSCCHKFYRTERHFHELFKRPSIIGLCKECQKKIIINYRLNVIPLANGRRLISINVFDSLPNNEFNLYADIYSKFFFKLVNKNLGYILITDIFNENDIYKYSLVSELVDADIFLLSFLLKTF